MTMTAMRAADPATLIAELRARGFWFERRGPDRLRIGPTDLLDEETVETVRARKPEVLALLAESTRTWTCARCNRFAFSLPSVCYWCRRLDESPARA